MSENLHDIDKFFRDPIEAHTEMPNDAVWDNIDKRLDKHQVNHINRKYIFLKRVSVALLLLLLGTLIYEIRSKQALQDSMEKKNKDTTVNGRSIAVIPVNGKSTNPDKFQPSTSGNNTNSIVTDKKSYPSVDEINNMIKPVKGNNLNSGIDIQSANKLTIQRGDEQEKLSAVTAKHLKNNNKSRAGKIDLQQSAIVETINEHRINKGNTRQKTMVSINRPNTVEEELTRENEFSDPLNRSLATGDYLFPFLKPAPDKINTAGFPDRIELLPGNYNKTVAISTANEKLLKSPVANMNHGLHLITSVFFAPLFSSDRIEDDRLEGRHNDRNAIRNNEQHQNAFSFGLAVELPVSKKWGIQSGITFLNKKINIEPQQIFAKMDNDGTVKYEFNCSSGYSLITPKTGTSPVVGDSISASASTNTLRYIGIPLAITYHFRIGKFGISPVLGASMNVLVKQKIETGLNYGSSYDKQTISNIEGLKPRYYNGFGGISLDYQLGKRIMANITPTANFALSSINQHATVRSYPNNLGVSAGIKIKF